MKNSKMKQHCLLKHKNQVRGLSVFSPYMYIYCSILAGSFHALFAGNIDDCFRLGVAVNNKIVKLYSEFYHSDILIASPLGLRMIIGAEGYVYHVSLRCGLVTHGHAWSGRKNVIMTSCHLWRWLLWTRLMCC